MKYFLIFPEKYFWIFPVKYFSIFFGRFNQWSVEVYSAKIWEISTRKIFIGKYRKIFHRKYLGYLSGNIEKDLSENTCRKYPENVLENNLRLNVMRIIPEKYHTILLPRVLLCKILWSTKRSWNYNLSDEPARRRKGPRRNGARDEPVSTNRTHAYISTQVLSLSLSISVSSLSQQHFSSTFISTLLILNAKWNDPLENVQTEREERQKHH